jgi:hypothetical protein
VTKYAYKNVGEAIAEALKVFITNPSLLEDLWPEHYAWLRDCGFEPVVHDHWSEVLRDSPRHLEVVGKQTCLNSSK